jgi:hypothetical protein
VGCRALKRKPALDTLGCNVQVRRRLSSDQRLSEMAAPNQLGPFGPSCYDTVDGFRRCQAYNVEVEMIRWCLKDPKRRVLTLDKFVLYTIESFREEVGATSFSVS